MKTYMHIVAMAAVVAMTAGISMAGSVNVGLGSMDQTEWDRLTQIMRNGDQAPTSMSPPPERDRIRVGEFSQSEVDAFRRAMVADTPINRTASANGRPDKVDIGTGSMETAEFCDLNKLVASNGRGSASGFAFICP